MEMDLCGVCQSDDNRNDWNTSYHQCETLKHEILIDERYKHLQGGFSNVADLHFSRLGGGEGLRASISLHCNQSMVVFLLLWSVPAPMTKLFYIRAVPVVNCSDVDSADLFETAQQILAQDVTPYLCYKLDDIPDQEQLFSELTRLIIEQREELQCLLSSKFTSPKSSCRARRLMKAFERPSMSVKMTSTMFDIYAAACIGDRDTKELTQDASNRNSACTQNQYCMVCFDEFDGNDLCLAACGHKVCIACWR